MYQEWPIQEKVGEFELNMNWKLRLTLSSQITKGKRGKSDNDEGSVLDHEYYCLALETGLTNHFMFSEIEYAVR